MVATSKLADLTTMSAAAKKVGMDRQRLRQLCIDSGIAIRWGGSDEHPILKVKFGELERVLIERQRYVAPRTPEAKPRKRAKASTGSIHPDVRC